MLYGKTLTSLVYLHDTDDRQHVIAAAVSDLARQKLGQLTSPARAVLERGPGT